MNSLIQIQKNKINGSEINSVNAREIYQYLELAKGQFSRWIKSAIDKYDFIQNQDYITIDIDVEGTKDYIVSLDMAKELCMVSNSEKGKETRKYFIEVEKSKNKPLTYEEVMQNALLLADKKVKEYTKMQKDCKNIRGF